MAVNSADQVTVRVLKKSLSYLLSNDSISVAEQVTGVLAALSAARQITNPILQRSVVRYIASKSQSIGKDGSVL